MHKYILNQIKAVHSEKSDELEEFTCGICGKSWKGKTKYISNIGDVTVLLCRKCANSRIKNEHLRKKFMNGNRIYGVVAEDCILGKDKRYCCFCDDALVKKPVRVLLYNRQNIPVRTGICEMKYCENCFVPFWNYKMVLELRKIGLHVKSIGNLRDFQKNFWRLATVKSTDLIIRNADNSVKAQKIVKTPPQTELDKVMATPSNKKVIKVRVNTNTKSEQLKSVNEHKDKETNIKICSKCRLNPTWLDYPICFDCYMKDIEGKKEKHQHQWSGGTGYGVE